MCTRSGRLGATASIITLIAVLLVAPAATAVTGDVTEWATPTPGASPLGIASGPDGALWFVERGADRIGRITPLGTVTEYLLPPTGGGPTAIAMGSDGAMWFTEQTTSSVGRITMDGTVTEYPVPTPASTPMGIALGPDGAMWFTEQAANKIGRMAPDGTVTEYPVPTASSGPTGITLGPDGAMWFTERRANGIGRIAPDGSVVEFALPGGRAPTGIVAGPDGALWFTAPLANAIGRVTTSGTASELMVPTPNSNPTGITLGPDGAVWFTEQAGTKLGQIAPDGSITEYPVPADWSGPHSLVGGPDGNLWFTESSISAVARLELVPPDTEAPIVTIAEPTDGTAYLVGHVAPAVYSCTDGGGSGLLACVGDVAVGAMLDTAALGVHRFTVTAVDGAGNTTTVEHRYIVFAAWDGRLVLPPGMATLRAGQPADLRFGLGGDLGPVLEPDSPFTQPVECDTGAVAAAIGPAVAVGPGIHLTGSGYTFRWRTERTWGGTCRQLVLPFIIQGGMTLRLTVRFV